MRPPVRAMPVAGGGAAAVLVGRDAPEYPVVQGMPALVATVVVLIAARILRPAAAGRLLGAGRPRAERPGSGRHGGGAPKRSWAP